MNLRDLRYLVAVADERHFGRAAQRCCVSQPTLSSQVKKLEEYLGVAIFERHPKSVEVTAAGVHIVGEARASVAHADAIANLAAAHRDPLSGTLDIGAIPTLCPYLMPRVLDALRERAPSTRLVFSEDVTEMLESKLRCNDIDAALLATSSDDHEFIEVPLFFEPFWLASPSEHWLASCEQIGKDELREAELLLLTDGHCLRQQSLEVCRGAANADDEFNDVRATSLQTLMHMVAAGYGSTLLPALAIDQWRGVDGVNIRAIDNAMAPTGRRISIVTRKSFPRMQALEKIAEAIRAAVPADVTLLAAAGYS